MLVPNERGLDNALALREHFHQANLFLSATESHNRANVNRSVEESLAGLERVTERALAEDLRVAAVVSVAFGCPYEGAGRARDRVRHRRPAGRSGRGRDRLRRHHGHGQPGPGARVLRPGLRAPARRGADRPLPQHPRPGTGQRARRPRGRRALVRVLLRRAGRLPGARRRHRQRGQRGPGVDVPRDGPRHRHRPGGAAGLRPGRAGGARPPAGQPPAHRRPGGLGRRGAS